MTVYRRITLLALVGVLCAACTSNTSGHGSGGSSTTPSSSGASSSATSAPTSSSSSPIPGNWPAHTNFGALPHADMHCAAAGLGGKVDVLKVVTADVTGDGIPDAIVRLQCAHSASSWPDTVDAYSDATGTPTLIGALLTSGDSSYATAIATSPTTVTLSLSRGSSFAPGCCPDLEYTQTFTWNGHAFTAGPRLNHLHPCGDTALVTTAGAEQGATGHSSVVLLFRNRLPQPCTVKGYPGLDATTSGGAVLAHAARTLNGFAGGAHSISTITVAPGASASATAEWMNFNPTTSGACATSASIMVTPANTTATVTLPVHATVCVLQIHPIVAGTSGNA